MSDAPDPADAATGSPESQQYWRALLEGHARALHYGRELFGKLPASERCQLCAAPFDGPMAPAIRLIGKSRWAKNPKFCASCFSQMYKHKGGAEVETALLFADVRGSTSIAETMSPTEFHELMDGFFMLASSVVVANDGVVDKFVGDEIVSIFVPGLAGDPPVQSALTAARQLMEQLDRREGPAYQVGAGVTSGVAFVGAIGTGSHVDMTAIGDPVNVAARLASSARGGEILVSAAAAERAELDTSSLESRRLELKGKTEATSVYVIV